MGQPLYSTTERPAPVTPSDEEGAAPQTKEGE
jgi:hypothetical protein